MELTAIGEKLLASEKRRTILWGHINDTGRDESSRLYFRALFRSGGSREHSSIHAPLPYGEHTGKTSPGLVIYSHRLMGNVVKRDSVITQKETKISSQNLNLFTVVI